MRPIQTQVFPLWLTSTYLQHVTLSYAHENGNYSSIAEAFPQLAGFEVDLGPPLTGEQNFTHCCLRAVDESLIIRNGYVEKSSTDYISNSSIDDLFEASDNGYFPCDSDSNEAYNKFIVKVSYNWLSKNCPGWSRVPLDSLSWVQSLVSFVLPAVVFCLSIPRRRKLTVPDSMFRAELTNILYWMVLPLVVSSALLIAVADTIFWLGCCLSFASPMLLSALYEAYLDYKVVGYLSGPFELDPKITPRDKAVVLFAILIGNLDLDIGKSEKANGSDGTSDGNSNIPNGNNDPAEMENEISDGNNFPLVVAQGVGSPLTDNSDGDTGGAADSASLLPILRGSDLPPQPIISEPETLSAWSYMTELIEGQLGETNEGQEPTKIELMKTQLLTMLDGQYSFGATIGAPVVFFMGGFIVALLSATTDPMDNTASLALAFAMWYTVIPHLAIVQGLLLAANNPSIFASIVRASRRPEPKGRSLIRRAYPSIFVPVSLWNRGPNKAVWLKRVEQHYFKGNKKIIKRAFGKPWNRWICMIGGCLALLFVPFILAFLTALETPVVGISCRSLTFLTHYFGQVALGFLWALPVLWDTETPLFSLSNIIGPSRTMYLPHWNTLKTKRFWCSLVWTLFIAISGAVSLFCAIAGTIMQLIGVYSGDICYVTIDSWGNSDKLSEFLVTISQNDPLAIKKAYVFWLICGSIGTGLLGLVTFFGWWYSKRVRVYFTALVDLLDSQVTESPKEGEVEQGQAS